MAAVSYHKNDWALLSAPQQCGQRAVTETCLGTIPCMTCLPEAPKRVGMTDG